MSVFFFHTCTLDKLTQSLFLGSFIVLGYFITACSSGPQKGNTSYEPQFIVTDSLVIEYLGELAMLDIKPDRSEYLLYDPQRSEFVRVSEGGEILQRKNLEEDGKDKFGDLFYTVHYIENNEILIFGTNQIHKYDQDLNLLRSSPFPFNIKSIFFNVGHVNWSTKENFLLTQLLWM